MSIMKTSLDHLPEVKRRELKIITDAIIEMAPVEMVILFGSYARGGWVVDRRFEKGKPVEYRSDYDILVVTRFLETAEDVVLWENVEEKFIYRRTPVNIICHSINEINSKIGERYYFFLDILKEGVMLYDSGEFGLAKPKSFTLEERHKAAREDFDEWFEKAQGFFKLYNHALQDGDLKIAAFVLHQATEHAYHAILLAFTGYKPYTHNIEKLGRWALEFHPDFYSAFPRSSPEQKYRFKLLKRAYVDARYKKNYKITPEELEYLSACVKKLHERAKILCERKIACFAHLKDS